MHQATLRFPTGRCLRSIRMPVLVMAMGGRQRAPQQHPFQFTQAVLFRFLRQAVLWMGMAVLLLNMPDRAMGVGWPNPEGEAKTQVWLISTHQADWQTDLSEALWRIRYWRLASSAEWEATDQAAFFASLASPMPTVIYIHGNWAQPDTAIQQAWTIYRPLWQAAGQRRFRLLVWCWPAERTSARLLTDLRFKAGRSDVEAYLLACHLEQMACSEPILLVGYSFGARVITGALHLVGGGRLMGRTVRPEVSPASESSGLCNPADPEKAIRTDRSPTPARFRAILVAAAIGNDWLLPGGRHHQALSQLEKLLVTVNRADPALRWYPHLEPCVSPALGWAGPKGGPSLHEQTPPTEHTGPQEKTGPTDASQPTEASAPTDETGSKDRPGPKEGIVPPDQTDLKNGATPKREIDSRYDRGGDSLPSRPGFVSSSAKIEVLWVTCSVGNRHDWRLYLQTPELQTRLPEYLFDRRPKPDEPR